PGAGRRCATRWTWKRSKEGSVLQREPLTNRQKEILQVLERSTADNGYPPTVREVCKATGLRSPRSVTQHLEALERKGYIRRGREKSRAIRFLHRDAGPSAPDVVSLPVLGANGECYLIDRRLVTGERAFLMRVEGESMRGAHITGGDLVIVDPEQSAQSGDVVVARVGAEATIKRLEERDGVLFLVSPSADAPPVMLERRELEPSIIGKVVGLVRGMS
ncbi:MAG: transcriptional repressor LexA, partial [Candidatus Krumholzibacteria bacterium]|nr:transcriptional repressor LexA [Candidatus Krumholzibacteria bacterium]